ncbi:hypothetical protein P9209_12465 [Prescottella defluvii]|nr:hypothetical protein P9209_12465 [Prescottella defluvii]
MSLSSTARGVIQDIERLEGAYIGGQLVSFDGVERIPVISPRDGRPIGDLHAADETQVDLAVHVAERPSVCRAGPPPRPVSAATS